MLQKGNIDKLQEEKEAFELLSSIKPEYISRYLYKNREKTSSEHKSSFSSEEELKTWFIREFDKWFIIHKDVKGKGYVNKKEFGLEADFILEPRAELIQKGVTPYIGVEVKYINTNKEFLTQLNKLSFQALSYSYSNSEWIINGKPITTDAFIVFTNLSFFTEKSIFETLDKYYYSWWTANLHFLNSYNYCKWDEKAGIALGNPKVVGKYRIGNIR